MSLIRFSIIVAIDAGNGIAKDGEIPWRSSPDMRQFRETTIGNGKNAVIMGRLTYESIPQEHRPLESRHNVIISHTYPEDPTISIFPSIGKALAGLGSNAKKYETVFIIGGERIYAEAIRDYLYLCDRIYVTKFKTDYECDQKFPYFSISNLPTICDPAKSIEYTRYIYDCKSIQHDEYQYLNLLRKIRDTGENIPDRTGVGTVSLFGEKMEFDISERLPIITTKKISFKNIVEELLFFISGQTDTRILNEKGVKIWNANTKQNVLEKLGLPWNEGDMGPGYGWQWRNWNGEYEGSVKEDGTSVRFKPGEYGIDQLQQLITGLRKNPHSRRHILTAWNVGQLDKMSLPPCHNYVQFHVSSDRKSLDCMLLMRSNDIVLGCPYNLTSYCLLTYMIAHICGYKPRKFVYMIGNAHIYSNHGEAVTRVLSRTPFPFPKLRFRASTSLHEIDDFNSDSFVLEGYQSWSTVDATMAV